MRSKKIKRSFCNVKVGYFDLVTVGKDEGRDIGFDELDRQCAIGGTSSLATSMYMKFSFQGEKELTKAVSVNELSGMKCFCIEEREELRILSGFKKEGCYSIEASVLHQSNLFGCVVRFGVWECLDCMFCMAVPRFKLDA